MYMYHYIYNTRHMHYSDDTCLITLICNNTMLVQRFGPHVFHKFVTVPTFVK